MVARWIWSFLIASTLLVFSPVRGEAAPPQPPQQPLLKNQQAQNQQPPASSPRSGWLPGLVAVVSSPLVHGAGHWTAGEVDTGYRLLAMGGVGLTAMLAGGATIGLSGASRRLIGVSYATGLGGLGLFVVSGLADIYGAASGGRAAGPLRVAPFVEARAGYAYIHDPQFAYGSFAVAEADARYGAFRLSPSVWMALDDDNQKYRFEAAYRFLGPPAHRSQRSRDGTFLDVETAISYHRFGTEGFKVLTWDILLAGRYDMGRLGRTLQGSFAEMAMGWALEFYGYTNPELSLGEDTADLLLMRFGYGLYIGGPGRRFGEVMLYYDHRHDDFAAGLALNNGWDGIPGHFGIRGFYYFTSRWGVSLDVAVGSSYLGRLSVLYRHGEQR